MFKSKILIGLLTGSISLISLGTITAVANPTGTSNWIARNLMGQNAQQAADDSLLGVLTNWISSTVPIETTDFDDGEDAAEVDTVELESVDGQIDTEASASATVDQEPGATGQPGTQAFGNAVDTVASATAQRIESVLNQPASSPVDAVASASTRLSTASGSSGTTAGSPTPVDTIASASQPKPGSTTTINPADQKGLITLEEAIAIARAAIENTGAVYAGYEFENDYPPIYEIFLTSGSTAYEIEVHATLGTVLEKKSESYSSEATGEVEEHDGETDDDGEHEVDD